MNDQKKLFESLTKEYESYLQNYMDKTRKDEGDVPHDRIAHELSLIDKKANSELTSDPQSPYGKEAYEKTRRDLRSKAFGKENA